MGTNGEKSPSRNDEAHAYALVTGAVLAARRCQRDLSQRDLAARSGVAQSSISRFERGDSTPDVWTLRCLAGALSLPLKQLAEDIERAWNGVQAGVQAAHGALCPTWWTLPGVSSALLTGLAELATGQEQRV